jgi:TRAP-type transport system small permease protein
MHALTRAYDRIAEACGAIAGGLVLVITLIITADVLLRNFLRDTIPGDIELSEYAMLFVTAFSAPWILKRGQHIRIDVILKTLPARVAWVCELLCDAIGLTLSLLLTVYGIRVAITSAQSGTKLVKEFIIPEWWILTPLPFMFSLLALGFVVRLHKVANGPRMARNEGAQI